MISMLTIIFTLNKLFNVYISYLMYASCRKIKCWHKIRGKIAIFHIPRFTGHEFSDPTFPFSIHSTHNSLTHNSHYILTHSHYILSSCILFLILYTYYSPVNYLYYLLIYIVFFIVYILKGFNIYFNNSTQGKYIG